MTTVEPRITVAVFGIFWHKSLAETARQVTISIEFVLQRDDQHIGSQSGLALFDAFASKEKTLHAHPGRHNQVPEYERGSSARFYARHLGRAADTASD